MENKKGAKRSTPNTVNIRFRIHFNTAYGTQVCVAGSLFSKWSGRNIMTYRESGEWEYNVELPVEPERFLEYKYYLLEGNENVIWEGGENRKLDLLELPQGVITEIRDSWRNSTSPEVTYFATSLFRKVIFHRENPQPAAQSLAKDIPPDSVLIRFEVVCTSINPNSKIYIIGSCPTLGSWDITQAIALSDATFPYWRLTLSIPRSQLPFRYKYIIIDETHSKVHWEEGADRGVYTLTDSYGQSTTLQYSTSPRASARVSLYNDNEFRSNFAWRGAGVAIPVFSLRTKKGLGIGEFLDIKVLVDWAVKAGLNLVQILPVNDTTVFKDFRDSYPYSSVSVYALNPIYLNIEAITEDPEILRVAKEKREVFNNLKEIDFVKVAHVKTALSKQVFVSVISTLDKDPEFVAFLKENKDWLPAYSLFCYFRDHFNTTDFSQWGENAVITKEQVESLTSPNSPNYSEILFNYFIQFHLHKQLLEASEYAKAHRVGLKGDLPIGVNRFSVDTWINPHLFKTNKSTGAPPDAFSQLGQNWNFPTYAWDVMAKDNYGWWKSRLGQMQKYFHAFRIDHILGFFRIWEIPYEHIVGLLGHFSPTVPVKLWELNANGIYAHHLERLTTPYIRHHTINHFVGSSAGHVIDKFLEEYHHNVFRFKPQFSTQKKIEASLTKEEEGLKDGLFRLMENIVLMTEDGENFYPRIEMMKTSSFQEFDDYLKPTLQRLYVSFFYERQDELYRRTGLERLPAIRNSSEMLVCGEDLGMVPNCVEPVMNQLGILGLRIQRMPADPKIEFYDPINYKYLTVCTTSSHDMSTLRGWWEEDRGRSQRVYNGVLRMYGDAPYFCEPYVSQSFLHSHLHSPSMWAVFPIQDLMGISPDLATRDPKEEKINEPSNPVHYWRYRLHVNIEELTQQHNSWTELLRFLIQSSGRTLNF